MTHLIIGISGRARHGKTEAASAIVGYVNGFSEAGAKLYDIGNIIRVHCIRRGFLPQVEREDMTREQLEILINVGRVEREKDEDFWINQIRKAIEFDAPEVAIVPNIRYRNEAEAVHNWGGYLLRMTRLNADGSTFISEDRPPNDISETSLEFWPSDFYITMKDGHAALVAEQAITLFEYLRSLHDSR